MTVTVYTKPSCVQCIQSTKTLDRGGVAYNKVDVTVDESAYEFVTKNLGFRAAPVIAVVDTDGAVLDAWSGFNPEKLATLSK